MTPNRELSSNSTARSACPACNGALEQIAHHQREGDYAGQVNAMRAIATDALAREERHV